MSINEYISQIESVIHSSAAAAGYSLNIDRRTEDFAFISGRIDFRDGSMLDFKEFLESRPPGIIKLKYGYNYRMASGMRFRYDNASDPRAKTLNSYPHHKHLGNEEIVASREVNLAEVLEEIESIMFHDRR